MTKENFTAAAEYLKGFYFSLDKSLKHLICPEWNAVFLQNYTQNFHSYTEKIVLHSKTFLFDCSCKYSYFKIVLWFSILFERWDNWIREKCTETVLLCHSQEQSYMNAEIKFKLIFFAFILEWVSSLIYFGESVKIKQFVQDVPKKLYFRILKRFDSYYSKEHLDKLVKTPTDADCSHPMYLLSFWYCKS